MAPKYNQSEKAAPPRKKKTKKLITLEEKMDILRSYDRGESTLAIKRRFCVSDSVLHTLRKNREKVMAAVKLGAGSLTRVTPRSLQSPTRPRFKATFGECNYFFFFLMSHLYLLFLYFNPFESIGRTGTSNIFLLKSAGL